MTALLYAFASVYALWVLYLAVMSLKRARDAGRMSPVAKALGLPLLFAGYFVDWVVNVLVFTPLFMDLPEKWSELVTGRMKRYVYQPKHEFSRRQRAALWFADHLLDDFDPTGKHV